MDRAAANLAKLEDLWQRAKPFLPDGPARGSHPEYDDLARAWKDLLAGLPPIDGWTITDELPDLDGLGAAFCDYFEIGEPPFSVYEAAEEPDRNIAEYRFRLHRARRRAARARLEELMTLIDGALPGLLDGVPRDSQEVLRSPAVGQITDAVREIERLMGDAAARTGRWQDLHRHLHFGQRHDWHDIREFDWPSVRPDVHSAAFADADPLPVPEIDLGQAAAGDLTGTATIALPWEQLDDAGFERLLYDLLRSIPEHHNVQWLTHTRAPDRGRDISLDRVLPTGPSGARIERVIVQAKHWRARSVGPREITDALTGVRLWEPPVVRGLIIATSGRFTTDAVAVHEHHNNTGAAPLIELWPDSALETHLAQKPHIAAAHGLR